MRKFMEMSYNPKVYACVYVNSKKCHIILGGSKTIFFEMQWAHADI